MSGRNWRWEYCTKDWKAVEVIGWTSYHSRSQNCVEYTIGGKHRKFRPWSDLRIVRLQCKDIPTLPILKFLAKQTGWSCWMETGDEEGMMPSVRRAMPWPIPDNLVLAKMRNLLKRELVDGCGCGCRGDFRITKKGREML